MCRGSRVDEWIGGSEMAKPKRRSWTVKSKTGKPSTVDDDKRETAESSGLSSQQAERKELQEAPASSKNKVASSDAAPASGHDTGSEYEVASDASSVSVSSVSSAGIKFEKNLDTVSKAAPSNNDSPDPSEYVKMREVREADNDRHDDFVGSYGNTGRVKREKAKPRKSNERFGKVDDWVGSGKTGRRSWKVKGST